MKPTCPIIFFLLLALVVGILPANGAGLLGGAVVVESSSRVCATTGQRTAVEYCQFAATAQAKSTYDDDFDDDDIDFEVIEAAKLLPLDWRVTDLFSAYSEQCFYSPAYLIQFSKRGPPTS